MLKILVDADSASATMDGTTPDIIRELAMANATIIARLTRDEESNTINHDKATTLIATLSDAVEYLLQDNVQERCTHIVNPKKGDSNANSR